MFKSIKYVHYICYSQIIIVNNYRFILYKKKKKIQNKCPGKKTIDIHRLIKIF